MSHEKNIADFQAKGDIKSFASGTAKKLNDWYKRNAEKIGEAESIVGAAAVIAGTCMMVANLVNEKPEILAAAVFVGGIAVANDGIARMTNGKGLAKEAIDLIKNPAPIKKKIAKLFQRKEKPAQKSKEELLMERQQRMQTFFQKGEFPR